MRSTSLVSATRRQFSRRRLLVAPLSPIGVALVSYVFFIACTIFPPQSYEAIMGEPDWMFLNPASIVFVTFCVLGYMAGVLMVGSTPIGRASAMDGRYLGSTAILVPLAAALALNSLSVLRIANNTPNLFAAWFTDAAAAKTDLDTTGALTQALPLLYAVCWWGLWQVMSRERLRDRRRSRLRWVLLVAFATALGTAVIKVARYDLMPMVFGTALVYLAFKLRDKRISIQRYLMFVFMLAFGVVALFVFFSWLRGSDSQSGLLNSVMGYTVASYDRLPALLDGRIRFPYGGTGTYTFRFLSNLPLFHRWIGTGMPDSVNVWLSEFSAVDAGGLDGRYIWGSAFGYVYADIGWAAPLYFFGVGALSMWAWRRLQAGYAAGILLYPWLGFSVIFWFGSNFVAYPQLVTLAGAAALLSIYERFAVKRVRPRDHSASMKVGTSFPLRSGR